MKLILFDIDKTLIKSSSSWRFIAPFKKVYGVDTNIDIINHHGMTDQQIIIEVLRKNGIDDKTIMAKLKDYMAEMVVYYKGASKMKEVVLIDGVVASLESLRNRGGFVMGLVTGNIEPIAWEKLRIAGIDWYFSIGGFGSDDINRTNLVKLAVSRANDKFKEQFSEIFIVGDSPLDIKAGKEAGVKTVGVATGIYSKEELKSMGADYCINNLREILNII